MSDLMSCNAGWIPSVSAGVSADTALLEGTPGLTPDDVYLPTLPPVDEEVYEVLGSEHAMHQFRGRKIKSGVLSLNMKPYFSVAERKPVTGHVMLCPWLLLLLASGCRGEGGKPKYPIEEISYVGNAW